MLSNGEFKQQQSLKEMPRGLLSPVAHEGLLKDLD